MTTKILKSFLDLVAVLPLTHYPEIRKRTSDDGLGRPQGFHAFGKARTGIIVGRVGKLSHALTRAGHRDAVVAYVFPSHDGEPSLIRVLENSPQTYINAPCDDPNGRRLNRSELHTADLYGPAIRFALHELESMVRYIRNQAKADRCREDAAIRRVQAIRFEDNSANWTPATSDEWAAMRIPAATVGRGPTADEASGLAELIGHPPLNAPKGN